MTDEFLLLSASTGELTAINRSDGERVWRVVRSPIAGPPLATGDGLLVMHFDRIALHDIATGSLIAERMFDGPRLHDVVVTTAGTFIANADGEISVYR